MSLRGVDASGSIKKYQFDVANNNAIKARKNSHSQKTKLLNSSIEIKNLSNLINNEKISPEVAIYLYERYFESKFPICLKTVYKYIKRKIIKIKPGILRHVNYYKAKKDPKIGKRIQKGDNISKRPEEANNREVFGHWEGDTVYSSRDDKSCLLTLVERKTRFLITVKIPDLQAIFSY